MQVQKLLLTLASVGVLHAQVTHDRLLNAAKEPENWLTYGGGFAGQRYSTLSQVTPENVKDLTLQWAFQQRSTEKFEATPLVVDGVMYLTQAPNDIVAMDAATGELKWIYSYLPSRESRPCCGRVNRGVAILGNTLYMVTIDAHIVAVDARDGKLVWDHEVAKAGAGYAMTHAPLVIKDKVIAGVAGAEFGIRGFIAAFDAATGKEAWRFYTIPGKGEPGNETWAGDSWMHGGASVWVTGSYDPETNLTFWGIGNPGPDYNSDKRGGDNLYSDCVVALDADTGKLKWYFQFTPHDDFDYDATQVPVLANVDWQGQQRKVMLWGNRNGFFYALDRTTGKYLRGTPFVKVTWATGLDEAGRPMRINGADAFGGGYRNISEPKRRHQLVFAILQPAHRPVLRERVGRRACDLQQNGCRVSGRRAFHGWRAQTNAARTARGASHEQTRGRRLRRGQSSRSGDRREEVGVQNGRRDPERHIDHRDGSAFYRWARGILSSSGCTHG